MKKAVSAESVILNEIPGQINDGVILHFLRTKEVNWKHVDAIKKLTDFNDDVISDWLNVSVKTFRAYRKPANAFKENVKEQILLLLAVIKHGIDAFGSIEAFDQWLNKENFYFDNKHPNTFLNTITGIRFVDDRLTAMEYGDNV